MQPKSYRYQIKIEGRLDRSWSDWFDGMELSYTRRGETILTGLIQDQEALQGILFKVRDLGLTLISVRRLEAG